jgi:protein tyrosine phosphatase
VDIQAIVATLREQRLWMVQTNEQYAMIYDTLKLLLTAALR